MAVLNRESGLESYSQAQTVNGQPWNLNLSRATPTTWNVPHILNWIKCASESINTSTSGPGRYHTTDHHYSLIGSDVQDLFMMKRNAIIPASDLLAISSPTPISLILGCCSLGIHLASYHRGATLPLCFDSTTPRVGLVSILSKRPIPRILQS